VRVLGNFGDTRRLSIDFPHLPLTETEFSAVRMIAL